MSFEHPLQRIATTALNMRSRLKVTTSCQNAHSRSTSTQLSYNFSSSFLDPEPLIPRLEAIGLSQKDSKTISDVFLRNVKKLQDLHRSICHKTYGDLSSMGTISPDILDGFVKLHEEKYQASVQKWQSDLLERTRDSVRNRSPKVVHDSEGGSPQRPAKVFNLEYVPFLEAFFSREQFPTRVDKLLLAKKSGMSYRQIHVWFQNRRSRAKQTSATLHEHSKSTSRQYHQATSDQTVVEDDHSESEYLSSRSSSFTLVAEETLESDSPSYAFPTKYPPRIEDKYDPYPCRFGDNSSFSKTLWERRPAIKPLAESDLDITALVGLFEKLSINANAVEDANGDLSRNDCLTLTPSQCAESTNLPPFSIRPSVAPLPALIRHHLIHNQCRPCLLSDQRTSVWQNLSSKKDIVFSDIPNQDDPSRYGREFPDKKVSSVTKPEKRKKKRSGPPRRIPISDPKRLTPTGEIQMPYPAPSSRLPGSVLAGFDSSSLKLLHNVLLPDAASYPSNGRRLWPLSLSLFDPEDDSRATLNFEGSSTRQRTEGTEVQGPSTPLIPPLSLSSSSRASSESRSPTTPILDFLEKSFPSEVPPKDTNNLYHRLLAHPGGSMESILESSTPVVDFYLERPFTAEGAFINSIRSDNFPFLPPVSYRSTLSTH